MFSPVKLPGINLVLFSLLIFYALKGFSQNLVPNPSFEDIVSCPTMESQIYLAEPWFSPYLCMGGTFDSCSSSDLFNECHNPVEPTNNVDAPFNMLGYQVPRTGSGYAGIGFWSENEWREKIETPLIYPLVKDNIYCVKMFVVNKRPDISPFSLTSTSNLHITLTVDTLIDYPNNFTYLEPLIKNPNSNIVTDSTHWIEISGCVKSLGGEKYLTIGSFYNNSNSTVANTGSLSAYYFIDDVSVELYDGLNCSCQGYDIVQPINPNSDHSLPNVFTPNNDGINEVWTTSFVDGSEYVIIINRWGIEVDTLNIDHPEWDGKVKGRSAADGVYYYKSFLRGEYKTGLIHLIR